MIAGIIVGALFGGGGYVIYRLLPPYNKNRVVKKRLKRETHIDDMRDL